MGRDGSSQRGHAPVRVDMSDLIKLILKICVNGLHLCRDDIKTSEFFENSEIKCLNTIFQEEWVAAESLWAYWYSS